MRTDREGTTIGVSVEATKQAEEAQRKWSWVEPCLWTPRMLTALDKGVKGGKWFSLIDKVYRPSNLESAWKKVASNKGAAGIDGVSIKRFEQRKDLYLLELHQALKEGTYRPKPVRRCYIPKPGTRKKRPLGIPTVKDRVVQMAMKHAIEPIFEDTFAEESYGFRPQRGPKDALRRVDALLKAGYTWVVDADIESYFDTVSHDELMQMIEEKIADSRVLGLIRAYLTQGVLEGAKKWQPEGGTPQGAVISPLLANIYLTLVDKEVKTAGHTMVRYADDFVILARSKEEAEQALALVRELLDKLKLNLSQEKTRIVDAENEEGFDFLGYHFRKGKRFPARKSLKKLKEKVRAKTKRTSGKSMSQMVEELNPILRGWFEYFKHSHKRIFPALDGWVRMRLRSILRKRSGGKGRGRGRDHQRWPIAFFAEMELFTLATAHYSACQSRCGNH